MEEYLPLPPTLGRETTHPSNLVVATDPPPPQVTPHMHWFHLSNVGICQDHRLELGWLTPTTYIKLVGAGSIKVKDLKFKKLSQEFKIK